MFGLETGPRETQAMNVKRILFPTDFSHCSDAALMYASILATEADALLYIVHVDEQTELAAAVGGQGHSVIDAAAFVGGVSDPDCARHFRAFPQSERNRRRSRLLQKSPEFNN